MPKYKNNTSAVITVGDLRMEAGETITTNTFIASRPNGISLESVDPTFDPIVHSAKVNATTNLPIPTAMANGCRIDIFCLSGEVGIQFNSASNKTLLLCAGMSFKQRTSNRVIDVLIFTITTGVAYVTITQD